MPASSSIAGASGVTALVRRIHRERLTGDVEVDLAEGRRRLHFVDGELHLPSDHPLATALAPLLRGLGSRRRTPGAAAAGDAALAAGNAALAGSGAPQVRALMTRIAFLVAGWAKHGSGRFAPRTGKARERLVGPLPTVLLLMEWAAGEDEAVLLGRLGGEDGQLEVEPQRTAAAAQAARLLDPQAAVLLARLNRATSVGDLLRQSAASRSRVLADVARLVAAGLVRSRDGEVEEPEEVPLGVAAQPVAPDVVRRYAERLGRELAVRPLVLDADSHRSRLADLLTRSGGLTAYELLGVSGAAGDAEVHEAYQRLGRLTHPDHAERLQLAGGDRPLWLLFEQVTAAYLTLSQPERRRRYDQRLSTLTATAPPVTARGDEERNLARSYYERAEALVEAEDFHFAVELLKQAVHTHPRPEYYVLLGRVQAKNPNWLRHAMDSYRKAMELGAEDGRISLALGRLCEEMENFDEARRHYESALAANPGEPDARAGLARLLSRQEEQPGEPSGRRWTLGGLLGRRT